MIILIAIWIICGWIGTYIFMEKYMDNWFDWFVVLVGGGVIGPFSFALEKFDSWL